MILLVPARIVACEGRLRWVVDLSKVIFFIGFVLRWAFSWSGPKNQFWVNKKDLDNLFWLKCLIDITGQVVVHSLEVESSEEELEAYSRIRLYNGISPLRWLCETNISIIDCLACLEGFHRDPLWEWLGFRLLDYWLIDRFVFRSFKSFG